MTPEEALVQQVNAAWANVYVSGAAAIATFVAVLAAFWLQWKQAKTDRENLNTQIAADRELVQITEERLIRTALEAARAAATGLEAITEPMHEWRFEAEQELQAIRSHKETVEYYLTRDVPDLPVVRALVTVRPLLEATVEDLSNWNGGRRRPETGRTFPLRERGE